MASELITTLITAITGFVTGMAGAFVDAFENIFMVSTDGAFTGLSNLGIFLIVLAGVSLGYGVIRYVTGLFRREV